MDSEIITIIIPFLNEGDEVENTVKSIRTHSDEKHIKIILIDDHSNDGVDYESISLKYQTTYIRNEKRLGVAASRDLGVNHSTTPYIMFLDAHMRFYDSKWSKRIIEELSKDSKALLCCQSKGYIYREGKLIEVKGRPNSYGAYIDFEDIFQLIEPKWIFADDPDPNERTVLIPCILGAAYACRRSYWIYLKGLNGLKYYGSDEPYISMKVWLSGGHCKLLKDIVVGHFYRNDFPYSIKSTFRWYNRLLLGELLLPHLKRAQIFSCIDIIDKQALLEFFKNRTLIYSLKRYYSKIFIHKFDYFERINSYYQRQKKPNNKFLLEEIAQYVTLNCNKLSNNGIINGRMGVVLFLFHYGRYSKRYTYTKFAYTILEDILNNLNTSDKLNIEDGITGIGWGISYLYNNSFIHGDPAEILVELDKKIINDIMCDSIKGHSELLGAILYVMSRLSISKNKTDSQIFTSELLSILYKKAQTVLLQNERIDNLRTLIYFCTFYEGIEKINKPCIYDLIYLRLPEQYNYKNFAIGLDGNSGIGLKLIFSEK